MNILVTGGAGYIGSHVCLSLLEAGFKVTIIDNLITGNESLIPKNAEFIKENIHNSEKINNILLKKKFDAVMHFAGFISVEESAKYPEKYFKNNTENSKIFFDICIKNKLLKIIFSSTAAVYGNPISENLIDEKSILNPLNPYAESKIKTEEYLKNNQNEKLRYVILRYFNVAGADLKKRSGLISKEPTHLIKILSEAAVGKRNKVIIHGNDYKTKDGTAIRDYIHVSDLADIHLESLKYILDNNHASIIMNCGYGKGYSVKEVINEMNKLCNNKINIENGPRRPGDSVKLVSDISKLKETINWMPKYNDLKIILKSSIEWEKKIKND